MVAGRSQHWTKFQNTFRIYFRKLTHGEIAEKPELAQDLIASHQDRILAYLKKYGFDVHVHQDQIDFTPGVKVQVLIQESYQQRLELEFRRWAAKENCRYTVTKSFPMKLLPHLARKIQEYIFGAMKVTIDGRRLIIGE